MATSRSFRLLPVSVLGAAVWGCTALPPARDCTQDVDGDGDGATTCDGDCSDTSAAVLPGAVEVSDGLDNDCDGWVDEPLVIDMGDISPAFENPEGLEGEIVVDARLVAIDPIVARVGEIVSAGGVRQVVDVTEGPGGDWVIAAAHESPIRAAKWFHLAPTTDGMLPYVSGLRSDPQACSDWGHAWAADPPGPHPLSLVQQLRQEGPLLDLDCLTNEFLVDPHGSAAADVLPVVGATQTGIVSFGLDVGTGSVVPGTGRMATTSPHVSGWLRVAPGCSLGGRDHLLVYGLQESWVFVGGLSSEAAPNLLTIRAPASEPPFGIGIGMELACGTGWFPGGESAVLVPWGDQITIYDPRAARAPGTDSPAWAPLVRSVDVAEPSLAVMGVRALGDINGDAATDLIAFWGDIVGREDIRTIAILDGATLAAGGDLEASKRVVIFGVGMEGLDVSRGQAGLVVLVGAYEGGVEAAFHYVLRVIKLPLGNANL